MTALMKTAWDVSMLVLPVDLPNAELNAAVTASGYMSKLKSKGER